MKVYLAARFDNRYFVEYEIASLFREAGHEVVSTWHNDQSRKLQKGWAAQAKKDLEDLDKADLLVLQTDAPGVYSTGGHHFESGYAYAKGIQIALVGRTENVFQELPPICHFNDYKELLDGLRD